MPIQAPTHLFHLLQAYDDAIKADAPTTSLRILREAYAYMLGHCCDLVGAACVALGASEDLYVRDADDAINWDECEMRLGEGFRFLQAKIEDSPLAKAVAEIFFDLSSGAPRTFYLLTQGGRVEGGGLGGLQRVSEFCKDPKKTPARADSFKIQNGYLPHMHMLLDPIGKFWSECTLVWERTSLKGKQLLCYRFHQHTLIVGSRSDLRECKACVPVRVVQIPESLAGQEWQLGIPQEVPDHLLHLVDRLSTAIEAKETIQSCNLMRDVLEFLLRYFAGVAKELCVDLEVYPDEARKFGRDTQSVDNCERLLQCCVDTLKGQMDDPSAKALVGVFYRRNANLELEPRAHTGVLLLEGVLSGWFKQERGVKPDAARSQRDFERYFPLLRDWVGAMGAFFSHTENFSEEPSEHGILPITVRVGERLLELQEPNYLLRIRQCPVCLPNPSWMKEVRASAELAELPVEAEAAAAAPVVDPDEGKTFPGEFRPLDIPPDAPKYFKRVLRRLDVRIRRGELQESCVALRDALDYLVRYWAGVCSTAARQAKVLPSSAKKDTLSIQDCQRLLHVSVERLKKASTSLAQEAIGVFYKVDIITDEFKPQGAHSRMLTMDASSENKMQLLADFCEKPFETNLTKCRTDLRTYLPVLRDWLSFSQSFFEQCEHHEEEPDKESRMELVVQFDQDFLELVAPDYAFYVRPGADQVPDLEVPEWVEPAEPEHVEETREKVRVLSAEELALQDPFLVHKVAFVGIQPNSREKPCKSGIIKIINAGGGSLTGRAFSTHPCLEISPTRFRDNTQLTYWLDESDIPKDFVPTIVLRSGGDERQITIAELRPLGTFNTMSKGQARIHLVAPAVLLMTGFTAWHMYTVSEVRTIMKGATMPFRQNAPDQLDQALVASQLNGWMFLFLPVLIPLLLHALYKRYSPSMQELTQGLFYRACLSPIPYVIAMYAIGVFRNDVTTNKELTTIYIYRLFPWFILFSLSTVAYFRLHLTNKIAEWISDPNLRKLVPAVLFGMFVMLSTLAFV